jgi:hypothetical protein
MPVVTPLAAQHVVRDNIDSLQITIPSRKQWPIILVLPVWLMGWALGEATVGGMLLLSLFSGPSLFMLVWFVAWTLGGGWAIYTLLWQIAGKEVVDINSQLITIRRMTLGIGIPKEYIGECVKDLRVSPPVYSSLGWSRGAEFWGLSGGWIAFDYGAKTIRFGSGVDEAGAKQVVSSIKERFPHYLPRG